MASRPLDSTLPQARNFASPAAALPGLAAGTAILYLSLVVLIPLAALLWAAVGGRLERVLGRRPGTGRGGGAQADRRGLADRRRPERVLRHPARLGAGARRLHRQERRQHAGRPAVRAADHRRRRDPPAALRRVFADRRGRVLQPGRHRARADVRDPAVRGTQRAAGAARARPRHGAGGRVAGRGRPSRPFAVSSSPTCCRPSCPAAGSPSPRRSASSAPSSSSQATSRSRPRWPRC